MSTRDPGLGPAHARQAVSGDGVDMHLPALLNVVRRWRMAVAGGQSGGQRPSPPACARPSVTGRHGSASNKPARDPDAPATTAPTRMRPRREQPHQRAVADAGAAVQLAFGVARRRRCISGGHTTVECQPTMQGDPKTARGRRASAQAYNASAWLPARRAPGLDEVQACGALAAPLSLRPADASVRAATDPTLEARPKQAPWAPEPRRSRRPEPAPHANVEDDRTPGGPSVSGRNEIGVGNVARA
jgi:hypothetical protein